MLTAGSPFTCFDASQYGKNHLLFYTKLSIVFKSDRSLNACAPVSHSLWQGTVVHWLDYCIVSKRMTSRICDHSGQLARRWMIGVEGSKPK